MTYGNTWRGLPEQAIIEYVNRLETRIKNLENRTFRIPVLEAAPTTGDPCNIWFYEDGRLFIRNSDGEVFTYRPEGFYTPPALAASPASSTGRKLWVVEGTGALKVRGPNGNVATYSADTPVDMTGTPEPPAPPPPKPPNPTKKTYTTTWTATWSESYEANGDRRTDNNHLYFGHYPSTYHDRQRSLIGFDYGAIKSALTGATINKVELYLYNLHAYSNSGVYIKLGGHSNASRPSSYAGAVKNLVSSVRWGKPESAYKTISNWFGDSFKSGSIKGILLDPQSDSISYYGYAAGVSDGGYGPPKVRITYTK